MATALWGKIYHNDDFAGVLRQEPGGRCVFTYDPAYLAANLPAIAFTLPLQAAPHICERGLHPFFDNLVAEGWLRNAQARALRIDPNNHLALLLAFGHDCAGAISVIDPNPAAEPVVDLDDPTAAAALVSRSSLSGVQAKLLAVPNGRRFRPARRDEVATFIAKLPSGTLGDIVENEFLTTVANRALLPDDQIVDAKIAKVDGIDGRVLLVPRFDRLRSGAKQHFEEFNQLLGRFSGDDKYEASYEDMGAFILQTRGCVPVDAWRLFQRVLVCFLTGNTDAHLKNFAMFHTPDGLRLTPAYDLVAAALYPPYRSLALAVDGAVNLKIEHLKPKHLIALAPAYGLDTAALMETLGRLDKRRAAAEKAVNAAAKKISDEALGHKLLDFMERRWNGTFSSTGQVLSKRLSGGGAN